MTSFSMRRLVPALMVTGAAVVALAAPGTASAASDLGTQCSGVNVKGVGSSFQNPILQKWGTDFNTSGNVYACAGKETQGSGGKPVVTYGSGGSGACLHAWGIETVEPTKFNEVSYCGTDEAPNEKQKGELESHKTGGEGKSLETIPVAQGAVAVIVHLPAGCKASSVLEVGLKKDKLGRLLFDNQVVAEIYEGKLRTWKAAIEKQQSLGGAGASDKLTCTGGATEEGSNITVVVRLDHSGTTHIFKAYLEQVSNEPWEAEEYPEVVGGKNTGCGKAFPAEPNYHWSEVAEACQNQRWPKAAEIVRGTESGNPGVVKRVNEVAGSIGYADLAVAREFKFFSEKGLGGENVKGSETKQGEQNVRFWAELQNTATPTEKGYADPSSTGDVTKAGNSNCAGTVYTEEAGKKFPPASTRESWHAAKAELVEKKYALCGLTYDLALREYEPYTGETAEGKAQATTAHDFLRWAVNAKAEGGGAYIKGSDYEKIPTSLVEEAEDGLEEVGFKTAGIAK